LQKKLGFDSIPDRTTIDRWKKSLGRELNELTTLLGNAYLDLKDSKWNMMDSTPIVDEEDEESEVGYNSRGKFIGFKLHMSCDEYLVPLRAEFTKANVHDVTVAENLLAPTKYGCADSAYDSKNLKLTAWQDYGIMLATGHNPRRLGKDKKRRMDKKFAEMRKRIEQLNSIVKNQIMNRFWTNIKGFKKKYVFCMLAVATAQILAIYNLKTRGYPFIRIKEVRA